jgi:hypothetical protein
VPGIYFDVDLATLKPASSRALTTIAELLRRQPQWRLSIEGHTDNSGGDAHNQDLSTRRAAAVKAALVRDFAIVPGRLTSARAGLSRRTTPSLAGRTTVASSWCGTAPGSRNAGDGLSLPSDAVGSIRTRYGLKARFDRLRECRMLAIVEMVQT